MEKVPPPTELKLYLKEWMALKRIRNRDLYNAVKETADIDESYVVNLKAGRKDGVSAQVLFYISEAMGLTVNDLYRRPPAQAQIESLTRFSDRALNGLLNPKNRRA